MVFLLRHNKFCSGNYAIGTLKTKDVYSFWQSSFQIKSGVLRVAIRRIAVEQQAPHGVVNFYIGYLFEHLHLFCKNAQVVPVGRYSKALTT